MGYILTDGNTYIFFRVRGFFKRSYLYNPGGNIEQALPLGYLLKTMVFQFPVNANINVGTTPGGSEIAENMQIQAGVAKELDVTKYITVTGPVIFVSNVPANGLIIYYVF